MNGVSSAPVDLKDALSGSVFETPSLDFTFLRSASTDPEENLSAEEELFERADLGQLGNTVRFWVNDKCLVRGKAKTPRYGWYREKEARALGIPVYERGTGGGVVYHDLGNLNWSFFIRIPGKLLSPERVFREGSAFVVEALRRLGVDAYFAPPNRIEVSGYKVSGMAARSTVRTLLVHGTLLLNSNLELLNRLCVPPTGCPPVRNINEWKQVDEDQFIDAVRSAMTDSGYNTVWKK